MFGVPNLCHRQRGSVIGVVPWVELRRRPLSRAGGLKNIKNKLFFSLFFRQSRQKSKNTKNYFFFYPCLRHFYLYVLILNDTTMLERVILGCIKVFTGKKGFLLFTTILVKIAQGHSTLAFTTYSYFLLKLTLVYTQNTGIRTLFSHTNTTIQYIIIWIVL